MTWFKCTIIDNGKERVVKKQTKGDNKSAIVDKLFNDYGLSVYIKAIDKVGD